MLILVAHAYHVRDVFHRRCALWHWAAYGRPLTGRHLQRIEGVLLPPQAPWSLCLLSSQYWWLCYVAYCLTMIAAKISIGLFLLRITIRSLHRWIINISMGLTVLTGIVFFFVTLLQCMPVSYFWDKSLANGRCINIEVIIGLTYLYSAISAICDFTFGILPIFLVWNLNMSRNSKFLLVPILSMACV